MPKSIKVLLVFLFLLFGGVPLLTVILPAPSSSVSVPQAEPAPTKEQAIADYKSALSTIPSMSTFVSGARLGLADGSVDIQVTPAFQNESSPTREAFAVALWESWVAASKPADVDKARIRLVDSQGRQVGGSRAIAGSVIYVD